MSFLRPIRHLSLCLGMALCLGVAITCYAQTLSLRVENNYIRRTDPVSGKQVKVEFHNTCHTICNEPNNVVSLGQSNHFQILRVRDDVCKYDESSQFFRYELFVKDLLLNQWYRTEWTANPNGELSDGMGDVPITIKEGSTEEILTIRLPLHDISKVKYITALINQDEGPVEADGAILNVPLSSKCAVPLFLKNNLNDMQILVSSVTLGYAQPDFWVLPEASSENGIKIRQGQSESINGFLIQPRPLKAIFNTFFRSKNSSDTGLNLSVHYAAQDGGNPMELSARIRVLFVPSLGYLVLAILIGSLIGATGRLIDPNVRTRFSTWIWSCSAALVGSAILELLGIVLKSLNSEFKLFGVALDPFQFSQVLLMATLVGVFGVNISVLVKQVLGLEKKPATE
jgi:hypothetical protein